MRAPDNGIPKELIDKAQAIAVFPGVLKAAFIFGGREGKGVISRRTAQGWTTPAFFNLGEIQIWPVLGVTIIALLLFWAGALVFAYVADDLSPAPRGRAECAGPKALLRICKDFEQDCDPCFSITPHEA